MEINFTIALGGPSAQLNKRTWRFDKIEVFGQKAAQAFCEVIRRTVEGLSKHISRDASRIDDVESAHAS